MQEKEVEKNHEEDQVNESTDQVENGKIFHNDIKDKNVSTPLKTEIKNEDDYTISLRNIKDYTRHYFTDNFINRVNPESKEYYIDSWITRLLKNSSLDTQLNLADEITDLKRKLKTTLAELQDTKADNENKIIEFEKLKNELSAKEKISHILTRISEGGRKKLLESKDFQALFKNSNKCEAVVVAIDIRRSTELMLKARTPELFSKFITELSYKLSQVIISNFGVFDKFTGDGILAFFPKFYSGNDAIIRSIKSANECHQAFKEHYNASKNCFNVFIKDVGLGIGIDYGIVTLVNTQSELTVVGIPVVYACRFSGAKAGETLINQPAREEIMNLCPNLATFNEEELIIKNEGTALGYNVTLNASAYNLQDPNWDELIMEFKS